MLVRKSQLNVLKLMSFLVPLDIENRDLFSLSLLIVFSSSVSSLKVPRRSFEWDSAVFSMIIFAGHDGNDMPTVCCEISCRELKTYHYSSYLKATSQSLKFSSLK